VNRLQPREWSELAEHWLHYVSDDIGLSVGIIIVIVAVALYALKWRKR